MGEMVPSGSQYTDEQRQQAIAIYAINGTASSVSRELNIPETTLCMWRKTDWWHAGLEEIRSANQDRQVSLYHKLTEKALEKADKGIDQLGDDLSASDIKALVVTGATATDKARLLLNQPTSISSKQDGMAELAAKFEELSKQNNRIQQDHDNIQRSVVKTVDKTVDNSEA